LGKLQWTVLHKQVNEITYPHAFFYSRKKSYDLLSINLFIHYRSEVLLFNEVNLSNMSKTVRKNVIREFYSRALLGAILSGILVMASLYQLEIILIWVHNGRGVFDFPFFTWTTNVWVARDVWYGVLVFGWVVGLWAAFKLGEVREFETILENPQDATVLREIIQIHKSEQISKDTFSG